ncbi:hypothetical protein CK203_050909 [Vitis vinifera]|uniref:Uncharacterized protein n=1 Tax=Vitis vinifera TaxID=29760 RepID=A0A438GQX3_VITVI|nr:hypothetical protein CK203_050909 [Vitis vinifera]
MNQLVARSLMRGLINGAKCNRSILCLVTRVELRDEKAAFGRMMSTETALAEKNQKEKSVEEVRSRVRLCSRATGEFSGLRSPEKMGVRGLGTVSWYPSFLFIFI